MKAKRSRLDRFISKHKVIPLRDVRLLIAQGRLWVDGEKAQSINQQVDQFSYVVLDEQVIQNQQPVYIMLHKPVGVVSATQDHRHKTVIDLLTRNDRETLHLVGRLDYNSSGLVLLTNDGRWSRQLTLPEEKVPKQYRVKVAHPICQDTVDAFAKGMYFPFEDITTQPASLKLISDRLAEVTLLEGRYHQIKRMFGRFRNPVLALHRISIGDLTLDPELMPGQSRELTVDELRLLGGAF